MTLIVSENIDEVENNLKMGKFACPACLSPLKRHGHGRSRLIWSCGGTKIEITPRRGRCDKCRKTQVLLPEILFIRRTYTAEVIGGALLDNAEGISANLIAKKLDIPFMTVRGWLRRFNKKADEIAKEFMSLALSLNASLNEVSPTGSKFKDAINAIGLAIEAYRVRLGDLKHWSMVSRVTKGALLLTRVQLYETPP